MLHVTDVTFMWSLAKHTYIVPVKSANGYYPMFNDIFTYLCNTWPDSIIWGIYYTYIMSRVGVLEKL